MWGRDPLLAMARRELSNRRAGVLSHACRFRVGADGVTESRRLTGRGKAPIYPFTGRSGALFYVCRSGVGAKPCPVAVEP